MISRDCADQRRRRVPVSTRRTITAGNHRHRVKQAHEETRKETRNKIDNSADKQLQRQTNKHTNKHTNTRWLRPWSLHARGPAGLGVRLVEVVADELCALLRVGECMCACVCVHARRECARVRGEPPRALSASSLGPARHSTTCDAATDQSTGRTACDVRSLRPKGQAGNTDHSPVGGSRLVRAVVCVRACAHDCVCGGGGGRVLRDGVRGRGG